MHKNAKVPQRLDTDEFPKLGRWVSRQREAYRNEKLRKEGKEPKGTQKINAHQIRRLERLGIQWVVPKVRKPKGARRVQRKVKKIKEPSATWMARFEELKQFKADFGHTRVPQKKELSAYPKLGRWVSRQREAYRNEKLRILQQQPKGSNKLSAKQIYLLHSIGMEWSIPTKKKKAKRSRSRRQRSKQPSDDDGDAPPNKRSAVESGDAVAATEQSGTVDVVASSL